MQHRAWLFILLLFSLAHIVEVTQHVTLSIVLFDVFYLRHALIIQLRLTDILGQLLDRLMRSQWLEKKGGQECSFQMLACVWNPVSHFLPIISICALLTDPYVAGASWGRVKREVITRSCTTHCHEAAHLGRRPAD